jgi:hypothetical protein
MLNVSEFHRCSQTSDRLSDTARIRSQQATLEAQAALMSMLGALAHHAPPYFKTVEELHAWVDQPISSEADDGSVRPIDVRTCLLT